MQRAEAYITTKNEEETAMIGRIMGSVIKRPLVIALEGELGAGKTVFVRGAAAGLEVKSRVSSPTFVLLKVHQGRLPLYHFDFYRLSDSESLDELGFEEYLPGDGVAFVEWAERFPWLLPEEYLHVKIERFYGEGEEGRRLWFTAKGVFAKQIIDTLFDTITWRTDGSLNL